MSCSKELGGSRLATAHGAATAGGPLKARIKRHLVSQFGRPRGALGRIAGWIMAARHSNRRRNAWTVDLLDIRSTDRVLEVGHGPGLALAAAARRATAGAVVGIDHSETMHRAAAARNRAALGDGRMELIVGPAEDLETLLECSRHGAFDCIFAVNVAMFWARPEPVLQALVQRLAPGGRLALTVQPRLSAAGEAAAAQAAERLSQALSAAGLADVRAEWLRELSPAAVCVIGTRPGA